MKDRTVVVFGSRGRVGRAVVAALAKIGCPVTAISWLDPTTKTAREWPQILAQLSTLSGGVDIILASGLTDPNISNSELTLANVERPVSLMEATIDRKQYRYLSLGSVLEMRSSLAASNPYLASKAALWTRIKRLAADPRFNGRLMHRRGHTFSGGARAPNRLIGPVYVG